MPAPLVRGAWLISQSLTSHEAVIFKVSVRMTDELCCELWITLRVHNKRTVCVRNALYLPLNHAPFIWQVKEMQHGLTTDSRNPSVSVMQQGGGAGNPAHVKGHQDDDGPGFAHHREGTTVRDRGLERSSS